ncbi:Fic/DOC family protein [Bifidobacterium longum]|nr:Fic/DOC family protein [Bifidobacterium longum]
MLSRSTEPEIAGTAEILERYLPSLVLLNDYDTGNVPIPKGDESQWVLTYEDAMLFIRSMPFYTQSDLFGRERNGSFQGIVAGLYQTFGGEELYRSTQKKAANLLYQVVKDHPFSDGNKRCAAALFVYFLNGNSIATMTPLLVEGNALAAMTLMIALSAPAGKDTMIALVENFLIRHESQEIN